MITVLAASTWAQSAFDLLPTGRPASLNIAGQERLNVKEPGAGFVLRIFDGVSVYEDPLTRVERDGDQLVVTNGDGIPRFTFRVVEDERHLALHLVRAEGMPRSREVSLSFSARTVSPVEIIEIDYMTTSKGGDDGSIVVTWPYLWHRNPDDPLGAVAFYADEGDAENDQALAEIWATEPLPRPAGHKSWTEDDIRRWLDAYEKKYARLSEMLVAASSPEELYYMTELARKAGIRRIYLHCDTWRGEYWPRYRSHVDVNPEVFPGGRADLVKYADHLHENGMLLRLHSVSGGIGWYDPERIVKSLHPDLASWGDLTLHEAIGETADEVLIRPAPGTEIPVHDSKRALLQSSMSVNYIRILDEIIRFEGVEDLDKPVWRLRECRRGYGGTEAVAHPANADGGGLYVPYRSNLIPGLDSPLLTTIAREYADLVNEAQLDHLHFDGVEIHSYEQWGSRKYTDLVYGMVDHPVSSSTSGGRHIDAQFERRFSRIRDLHELDYFGLRISLLLAGHREATSLLDSHFDVTALMRHGGRRIVLIKPEPMFGINRELYEGHGLSPQLFDLAGDCIELMPKLTKQDEAVLDRYLRKNTSALRQRGNHYESEDVLFLEKKDDGFYWVPTRVMVRETGDVPWRHGQEHGAIGPRQVIRPGDDLRLINPYAAQTPDFIIRVMAECVDQTTSRVTSAGGDENAATVDDYRTGADLAGRAAEAVKAATTTATSTPLQPAELANIQDQRFTKVSSSDDGLVLTATNPTLEPLWIEEDLPWWPQEVSMAAGRGIAMRVTGDGSGAVLVVRLQGRGTRDYVCKVDFTGTREIVIPHGEAAWYDGCWGWRFGTKTFDYSKAVTKIGLGIGFIPPETTVRIRVADLRTQVDQPTVLPNPTIHVGAGSLLIDGEIATGHYIRYDGGATAAILDLNWNHVAELPVTTNAFVMPEGKAAVSIQVPAGAPCPWLETQFITRDTPIPIGRQ